MPDKHPDFWRVKARVHERDAAQLRAQMAAQLASMADAALAQALTEAGFDPKANFRLDDVDESITLDAVAGVKVE